MRKRIYQTVHVYEGNLLSVVYKVFMVTVILASLIPLAFKAEYPLFAAIEWVCLAIFVVDYLLRWMTADYKFGDRSPASFIKYPFRPMSVIDFMSIFALFCSRSALTIRFELAEILIILRIVRLFRYSKGVRTILHIFANTKKPLIAVGSLAVGYILASALIIFNVEPDSFHTFFDAVYWATVSLTTVGYGDLYPVTVLGRTVAMVSSFFGIAVVALPAGIITAEYLSMLKKDQA